MFRQVNVETADIFNCKPLQVTFLTFVLGLVNVAVEPGPILGGAFPLSPGIFEADLDFCTGFSGKQPLAFSKIILTGPCDPGCKHY